MIYFPLVEGTKRPAVEGWADPEYAGVEPEWPGWYGRRCDGLVVIDCDDKDAAKAWLDGHPERETYTVRTPRGWHFYYHWTPGSPDGPRVGVLPHTDVRAGRGSYVVAPGAPGYSCVVSEPEPVDFDPAWVPKRDPKTETDGSGWDVIPEGQRNSTLAALAGSLRKQGASAKTIVQTLGAVNKAYCDPPLDRDEVVLVARSVSRYEPDPDGDEKIEFAQSGWQPQWWDTMELPPPPEWYWKPYLPAGRLVFLDGREGIGKGMFCTFLAKCVVTGRGPDGTQHEPGNVLWLPAEDDPEEDILRRLYAAGAKPESTDGKVAFLTDDQVRLPEHEAQLTELIRECGATLVILDPGRAFLGPAPGHDGKDFSYNNEAHVRPGMQACLRIAKATGATIMFVHHWNKNVGGDINYRASGSGAFNQVIRHRITIARVEDPDGFINGAFAVTKSNIASVGHVHGYTLEEEPVLDTAIFRLTDPKRDGTLDEWEKRVKNSQAERMLKPGFQVENYLALHGYRIGDPAPSREEIEKALDMSQGDAKQALASLRQRGVIGQRGPGPAVVLNDPSHYIPVDE